MSRILAETAIRVLAKRLNDRAALYNNADEGDKALEAELHRALDPLLEAAQKITQQNNIELACDRQPVDDLLKILKDWA